MPDTTTIIGGAAALVALAAWQWPRIAALWQRVDDEDKTTPEAWHDAVGCWKHLRDAMEQASEEAAVEALDNEVKPALIRLISEDVFHA